MMHASDGQLLAYLDDELTAAQRSEVASHLSTCVECESGLRHLETISAEFHDAVSWLEVAVPLERARARFDEARREAGAAAVMPPRRRQVAAVPLERARTRFDEARREAGAATVTPNRRRQVALLLGRVGLLKAAALAALLAGAASAAIPGSPVREWVATVLGIGQVEPIEAPAIEPVETPVQPAAPVESAQEAVPAPMLRGLPERNRIQVRLHDVAGRVIVRYVDDDAAAIRPVNVNAEAFSSAGVLEMRRLGSGDVYVDIPNAVQNARVEVNGDLYLEKRNGATTAYGPTLENTGILFSFPPRS